MVINDACRTSTRIPGVSREKFMHLPKMSNIRAFSATLNRMMEERLPSLMVVKLRDSLSTSRILPIVILSEQLHLVSILAPEFVVYNIIFTEKHEGSDEGEYKLFMRASLRPELPV